MAALTWSVRVVQLRIESRLWMEKLEDQLMSASGKLQRGMRWPVKVQKGPFKPVPDLGCEYRGEQNRRVPALIPSCRPPAIRDSQLGFRTSRA